MQNERRKGKKNETVMGLLFHLSEKKWQLVL
jgi:hypothetical protein